MHGRRSFSKVGTSFESNLLGLRWAVESLSNLHHHKVMMELPSKEVVMAISQPQRYPLFRHIISDVRNFLSTFEDWTAEHVPEGSN